MNILFIGAHHDDLEVSIGASVKRWVDDGHKVFSAILTNSTWNGPDGKKYRDPQLIEKYCRNASNILGYTQFNLNYCSCFELTYTDEKVVDVLNIINDKNIDTLVTIWPYDAHKDHRMASEIACSASRKVPRVLFAKVSWNSTMQTFKPKYFVDVSRQFEAKREALKCYEDEYERTGLLWEQYILASARSFGLEAGCRLAEGFEVLKYVY